MSVASSSISSKQCFRRWLKSIFTRIYPKQQQQLLQTSIMNKTHTQLKNLNKNCRTTFWEKNAYVIQPSSLPLRTTKKNAHTYIYGIIISAVTYIFTKACSSLLYLLTIYTLYLYIYKKERNYSSSSKTTTTTWTNGTSIPLYTHLYESLLFRRIGETQAKCLFYK